MYNNLFKIVTLVAISFLFCLLPSVGSTVTNPTRELSGASPELEPERIAVRVSGERKLTGPYFTIGPFWTPLYDEHYIKKTQVVNDTDTDIVFNGVQERYSFFGGILAHLPIYSKNYNSIRTATALSFGLGLSNILQSDGSSKLGEIPVTLGVSVLIAGKKSDSLFAITGGIASKPVERLDGYLVGGVYPSVAKITKPVRRNGFFISMTVSHDIMSQIRELIK